MSKLFQMYENDLQKLEMALPILHEALGVRLNDPKMQVALEDCKEILSNVRWNYGPHTHVEIVPL